MKQTPCALALIALAACSPPQVGHQEFRTGLVEKRDIVITVEAAGVIQPFRTVEVKSKASGEVLSIHAESGDFVEEGQILVQIDKRVPRNQLALVESQREAALARRSIAVAQHDRAARLFKSHSINEVDYERSVLEVADAKAEVVRTQISIENAKFALDDTEVKAPISGTIIEKLVERGQVISSPTMDVGGGNVLMTMADLRTVQVQALVNEIDIGKISPGQPVTVSVVAYPNRPFRGHVVKVEPQALAEQTVTTFPVLLALENSDSLLRPGMNADVAILVEERRDVAAIPVAALRTPADISVTADLVGISELELRAAVDTAMSDTALPAGEMTSHPTSLSVDGAPELLPVNAGKLVSPAYGYYWALIPVARGYQPVSVVTDITDYDYSEVVTGVNIGTKVVLLPSSGLIQSQRSLQRRFERLSSLGSAIQTSE